MNKLVTFISNRKQGLGFLGINLIGNSFTFSINLILPFFLSIQGYGFFALIFAFHNVMIALFTFGLDASIIKFTLEKKNNTNILYTALIAWGVMTLFFLPLLLSIGWVVVKFGFLKMDYITFLLVLISAVLISFQRVVLSYYIAKSAITNYGKLFIFNKLIQFILILTPVFIFNEASNLNIMSYLFLVQGFLTLMYIFIFEKIVFLNYFPKRIEIKELIRFTLPLSINTLGNLGYSYGFNIFVSPFLTLGQFGILNIFTQLGNVAMMTINSLNNGYIPKFYKQFTNNFTLSVKNYSKYIFQNSILIIISVIIIGIIYKFYAYEYNLDYSIFLLLIYFLGIFLYSFKSLGSNYLIIENKTAKISVITLFTSILNIILGLLLTKLWGFEGCIISLSFGYFIQVYFFNFDIIRDFKQKRI